MTELGDDEFVGYVFKYGAPPQRPRLWFIDRELRELCPEHTAGLNTRLVMTRSNGVGAWSCRAPESRWLQDACIRWQSHGTFNGFTAVWKLTNICIPHIQTFGRDDDVWRLGLWPD